jgi:hypothetical protein
MTSHHVPKSERSIAFARVDALLVDDPPLDIAPVADNNVMKVTADCLFMRTSKGRLYGGRGSMSWWLAVMTIFVLFMFSVFNYGNGLYEVKAGKYSGGVLAFFFEYWFYPVGVAFAAFLFSFWILIPWRRQLPIIFNRKTGQVTCAIDNQIVSCHWQDTEAYIKDVTSVSAGGVPLNEGVLNLIFVDGDGKRLRAAIPATKDDPKIFVQRGIVGAAAVWEFIRLYMKEGADALPPIVPLGKYRFDHLSECFTTANPFKIFKVQKKINLIWSVLFFPLALPIGVIAILGDLLYFALDRILPKRKWPQALLDACDSVWDGKGD